MDGANPERTAWERSSRPETRQHERPAVKRIDRFSPVEAARGRAMESQKACGGTGRQHPCNGVRLHTEVLMSSPDGQVSEMAAISEPAAAGLVLFGISSTSTRATTRHPGRTLWQDRPTVGIVGAPGVARGQGFARSRRCRTGSSWLRKYPGAGAVRCGHPDRRRVSN